MSEADPSSKWHSKTIPVRRITEVWPGKEAGHLLTGKKEMQAWENKSLFCKRQHFQKAHELTETCGANRVSYSPGLILLR